jgi:hypothetical protein
MAREPRKTFAGREDTSMDGAWKMADLGGELKNTSTATLTRSLESNNGNHGNNNAQKDIEGRGEPVVADMETMALKALHVDDDPSLNPWTLRMFVLGTCSCL